MTAKEVEYALVCPPRAPFNFQRCIVVPNISWGMFNYELDLLSITKAGYASEIEIKVSKSDLIADKKKRHGHRDYKNRIKHLYFVGPAKLQKALLEHAPRRAGVIIVREDGLCVTIKNPKTQRDFRKLTDKEIMKLMLLAYIRFWTRRDK